ncbi:hypothetical protein [Kaistella carnis]|uniref:hypothetical protein n=1 Tax=Kaistella carnis TaxID=1241979 RepID=UPI0013DE199F|nr:hypothetical protein [Kaistella carnis]
MEPDKKNRPGPLVIFAIAAIVIAIISYFILLVFFPDLFQDLPVGSQTPVSN